MQALCVVGARPNFVKLKPVADALQGRGVDVQVVHTGQHYNDAMSAVFFAELGLRSPDHSLGVGSGTQAEQTARILTSLEPLVDTLRPDLMIVFGDVNSTLAGALVAAKACVPLAHVEAGLRSRDRTMPEEVNRVVTDHLSDYLFAPSPDAVDNLAAEGIVSGVHLVGNVMVDTLLASLPRARTRPMLERLGLEPGGYGLVTLHRPSNVDSLANLAGLLRALGAIAETCPLVFPVHPRTASNIAQLDAPARVTILPPLGYLDFLALEASARLVLTDSGGVQEETTALGVPCLTLRRSTERPVTVTEGTNQLVGDLAHAIVSAARSTLANPPPPRHPALWDGHAAERIATVLADL